MIKYRGFGYKIKKVFTDKVGIFGWQISHLDFMGNVKINPDETIFETEQDAINHAENSIDAIIDSL